MSAEQPPDWTEIPGHLRTIEAYGETTVVVEAAKLEEAANDGRLSKDKTFTDVIDAMKAAQDAQPAGGKPAKPAKKIFGRIGELVFT